MRYILLYIGLILFGLSCSKTDHEIIVDSMVESAINKDFKTVDKELWKYVESEFYNCMKRLNLFDKQDSIKSIHNLNNLVGAVGYRTDFFINMEDSLNREKISKLQKVGIEIGDECAQNYIYEIIEPIVSNYEDENKITLDTTNLIKAITLHSPDSVSCSFDLFISALEEENRLQRFWNKPGTRKIIILTYFSRMIDKEL